MSKFTLKKCCTCKEELHISAFSWRNKNKGTYAAACKSCHKSYLKSHYEKNKDKYVKRATTHNLNNPRRKAISRYSYAKQKGYAKCNCCTREQLEEIYLRCPDGYEVDHILNRYLGGLNCIFNLQYLHPIKHKSKSGKEGAVIRWGKTYE